MKLFKLTAFIIAALAMVACDDTTDTIGSSITSNVDKLTINDSVFNVVTESRLAGAVLSTSNTGIIGKVRDPETGTYLSADYMAQMIPFQNFGISNQDSIIIANMREEALKEGREFTMPTSKIDVKENLKYLKADSCFILVSYQNTYGDTLAPMKVTAYEMSKPLEETQENCMTDFDPFEKGYVSKSNNHTSATYTTGKTGAFKIYLNKEYTDKDGKTYNNYGTYLMQKYVEDPKKFKNNYDFLHDICPGFYIKSEGGLGNVTEVWNTEVQFYWKWKLKDNIKTKDGLRDSVIYGTGMSRLDGTEEVLQTNHITNSGLDKLITESESNDYTYVKSPAGIYTMATLPVDDIIKGHESDTLNTARISFPRIVNSDEENEYAFDTPPYLLLVPADSVETFFAKGKIVNNTTYYYTAYSSSTNAYTFSNISNLVSLMHKVPAAERTADWNKVALIPVSIKTATEGTSTVISKITHNMGLSSTRLVKGTDRKGGTGAGYDYTKEEGTGYIIPSGPVQIKVIYSKFKER